MTGPKLATSGMQLEAAYPKASSLVRYLYLLVSSDKIKQFSMHSLKRGCIEYCRIHRLRCLPTFVKIEWFRYECESLNYLRM